MCWRTTALILLASIFGTGCTSMKIVYPGSLNAPRVMNVVTTNQKLEVNFAFVQKIATSKSETKDFYLFLNKPQSIDKLEKTKSLELSVWVLNPNQTPYALKQTVCDYRLSTIIDCKEAVIYKGRERQKEFHLLAPLQTGSSKLIRGLLTDEHGFPILIIGDGIYKTKP